MIIYYYSLYIKIIKLYIFYTPIIGKWHSASRTWIFAASINKKRLTLTCRSFHMSQTAYLRWQSSNLKCHPSKLPPTWNKGKEHKELFLREPWWLPSPVTTLGRMQFCQYDNMFDCEVSSAGSQGNTQVGVPQLGPTVMDRSTSTGRIWWFLFSYALEAIMMRIW